MSFSELIRTALHSLRINPIRSALAVLGVIFGIAAVVVLISMGQGVRSQISDQIKGLGTDLLIVRSGLEEGVEDQEIRPEAGQAIPLDSSTLNDQDVAVVSGLEEHVSSATGTIERQDKAEAGEKALSVNIIAADANFPNVRKLEFAERADDYSFENQGEENRSTCAIGQQVKELLFGKDAEDVIGSQLKIGTGTYTIKAITKEKEKSFFSNPNRDVYVPINALRTPDTPDADKVLEIYTSAKDASRVDEAKEAITATIDEKHAERLHEKDPNAPYEKDFHVATQEDLMKSYKKILSILNALVLGVALVALIESGIGVSNIMYIAVRERTREIGVRLAQGASSRAILIQFLFESVIICLVGAVIGVPLGYLVSVLINSQTVLPAQTPLWGVLVAFAAATFVGVVAGVYPAWKATKADIAEVLRAE
jgi:putative ABC transport system permease protein